MTRTRDQIRANLLDANVIATLGPGALTAMTTALGGYASSTPGAAPASPSPPPEYSGECKESDCTHKRPCPDHDSAINLTQPERLATTNDPAAVALARFQKDIAQAQIHLANAARIATRWAMPGMNNTQIAERLVTIEEELYCRNCIRYGEHAMRREGKTTCKFCGGFKADYGFDAPKGIFEARKARGGKVYTIDIERVLDRDMAGWRKKKKHKGGNAA